MPMSDCDDRLRPEPFWRRLLRRLADLSAAPEEVGGEADTHLPVYRITRASDDCWIVQRPGSMLEHAFDDARSAEDFVRHECADAVAMVVLRIDSFYAAARIDRNVPRIFPLPQSR